MIKDYRTEIFPLNNFALWTKGWYEKVHHTSTDKNIILFEDLKSVLELDDYYTKYSTIRDFARIIINVFDDYNKWCRDNMLNYMRLSIFLDNIKTYESSGFGYFESIIMTIRSFIQTVPVENIKLTKPVYSKELYKRYDLVMGKLLGTYKHGQPYKEMNKIVNTYNW